MNSKRLLLAGFALLAAVALQTFTSAAQIPGSLESHRQLESAQDNRPEQGSPQPQGMPVPDKRALEENQKQIRADVDRLYDLAAELKAEVAKTDASNVYSATLVKKAQEIEKLAKSIKSRSKT